jgi:hypothetical protein
MEKREQFNPHDEKYKEVADLPEDQQQNFVDTENGGFVRKEVLKSDEKFKTEADAKNSERSFAQKIIRKGKLQFTDIAHEDALEEDKAREEKKQKLQDFLEKEFRENRDLKPREKSLSEEIKKIGREFSSFITWNSNESGEARIESFAQKYKSEFKIDKNFLEKLYANSLDYNDSEADQIGIIEYAKKNNIEFDIRSAFQLGYEYQRQRNFCYIWDFLRKAKEQDVKIEVDKEDARKIFLRNTETKEFYRFEGYIDFAEQYGLELDLQNDLQMILEGQLAHGQMDNAQKIIDFAEKEGIQLNTKEDLEKDMYIRIIHNPHKGHAQHWRKEALKFLGENGFSYEDIVKMDYLDYLNVPVDKRLDKKTSIEIEEQAISIIIYGQKKEFPVRGKFIIGASSEHDLTFVFDGTLGEHKDIGVKYDLQVIGGGWLEIDEQNKKVRIYGSSRDFGYEPRSISTQAVTKAFEGYEIAVEN